jgi:hypothetical protein
MKTLISTIIIFGIILFLGFTFKLSNSPKYDFPTGFNCSLPVCSGTSAHVDCYIHGTSTKVSFCDDPLHNSCAVDMCNQSAGYYDLYGNNGGGTGHLLNQYWTGGCFTIIDKTINITDCSGPGQ